MTSSAPFDVPALRRQFPLYQALTAPLHYLDSAATAQMHAVAFAAMADHDRHARGNVLRGNHRLAEAATAAYEEARAMVARFLHAACADEVVFTAGTTAAINLVAGALAQQLKPGDEVAVSLAEHHSNFLPWQQLAQRGIRLKRMPLTPEGRIEIADAITDRCRLVAVTHASNVTGASTDLPALVAAARAVGAQVLVDGAQQVQHGPVDVQALGVDFYAFSGHKCFGPTGIGVLWGRSAALAALPPFLTGGGMVAEVGLDQSTWAPPPRRFEAGTPPIAQAVGLGAVLAWMGTLDWQAIHRHEQALLAQLLAGLRAISGLRILGPAEARDRLPVVSFNLAHHHSHDVCQVLDDCGVAVRGGQHCAQPLMAFFGADGAVRASLALYNDEADVAALLAGLEKCLAVLA